MQFKVHGCRGSIPVAGVQYSRYGGNTTCIRILSGLLPEDTALFLDAGSGLVPASKELLAEGIKRVYILFTHYHWDHTIGLTLSPLMFMKHIPLTMAGPVQDGVGTRQVCQTLFSQPYFPVDFREVGSHITHEPIDVPGAHVILMHRRGGFAVLDRDRFEVLVARGAPMPFADDEFGLDECLLIRMHRSNHPEDTITYRVEERSTGQRFALLTDHENQDAIPMALKAHLQDVDSLLADCQYTRHQYDSFTAGFGHGTPDYVVKLARHVGANHLLLTHHDPGSSDEQLEKILEEALRFQKSLGPPGDIPIQLARDGVVYDVG